MEQQEQQNGFVDALLKVAAAALLAELSKGAPKLVKLGVDGIAKLLHKHKAAIVEAATPVTTQDDPPHNCPIGQIWNPILKQCVDDLGK